jgi:hypothetical protein
MTRRTVSALQAGASMTRNAVPALGRELPLPPISLSIFEFPSSS